MRVGLLASEIFWGLLLILLGITAVLRSFDINISFFRVIFAFVLIYLGVALMVGGPLVRHVTEDTIIFGEVRRSFEDLPDNEFNIIFGNGELDLRGVSGEELKTLEMNVIFGSGKIIISPEQRIEAKVSSVFGNAVFPDGSSISFGDYTYQSLDPAEEITTTILIDGSVVFGRLEVEKR